MNTAPIPRPPDGAVINYGAGAAKWSETKGVWVDCHDGGEIRPDNLPELHRHIEARWMRQAHVNRPTYAGGRPGPTTHVLKCVSPYFEEVAAERKHYELRKADRDYRVGDLLLLRHYDPATDSYSGKEELRKVTYILHGPFPVVTDATQVPCSTCGALPRRVRIHGFVGVDCKTWAEGTGGACVAGSWTDDQWIKNHHRPGLAPGWCTMSVENVFKAKTNEK